MNISHFFNRTNVRRVAIGMVLSGSSTMALGDSYYVDSSCPVNGNGLSTACATAAGGPGAFSDFSTPNTWSGDRQGAALLIKRGTVTRSGIAISNASNFTIDAYGSGAKPVLLGTDIVKWSWNAYSGQSSRPCWYSYDAMENTILVVGGVKLIPAADLNTLLKGQRSSNLSTTAPLTTQYWDQATHTMYACPTTNPALSVVQASGSKKPNGVLLTGVQNVVVQNLVARNWYNTGINFVSGIGQMAVRNNEVYDNGANAPLLSNDGIKVYGSMVTPAKDVVIEGNVAKNNSNGGIEVWGLDGASIKANYLYGNGQGIELWGYVTNVSITSNRILETYRWNPVSVGGENAVWSTRIATGSNTGRNDNIVIENNVFANVNQRRVFQDAQGGSQRYTIVIESGSVTLRNNTLFDVTPGWVVDSYQCLDGACTVTKYNNIIVNSSTGPLSGGQGTNYNSTNVSVVGDYNVYFTWNDLSKFGSIYFAKASRLEFKDYQAAIAPQEASSIAANPHFNNVIAYDFSIGADDQPGLSFTAGASP